MANAYLIIIDGLGVGAQEDSHLYGDVGTNTAGHVIARTRCQLPNFQQLGLGNIIPLDTVPPAASPLAAWGKMREVSAGKDSTTGHWELAGVSMDQAFPVYPEGFPDDVIQAYCKATGVDRVLANAPYSGTDVIELFGPEHQESGQPIVYTSADSVFQIACHTDTIPLETLYEWCQIARDQIMVGDHAVGRVIARPFTGSKGSYRRLSDQRKDYSLAPPYPNLPEFLNRGGVQTYSIGKIIDLFSGKGFSQYRKTNSNAEGISQLLSAMKAVKDSFVFVNLIDTDQLFGHRNDPEGFAGALEEFDRALPAILQNLGSDDIMIITGDHGNDPTTPGTDHTREFVPLLVYPLASAVSPELGIRGSFRDVAVSVAAFFGKDNPFIGVSFLQ